MSDHGNFRLGVGPAVLLRAAREFTGIGGYLTDSENPAWYCIGTHTSVWVALRPVSKGKVMASVYRRSKTKGAPYYIKYVDHLGRQIQVKASPDLAASRQIAVQLESAVARKKLGLVDDAAERIAAEANRPIDEHIADFEAHLRSKGNSPRHVTDTTMRVRTAAQVCQWAKLADITPESLNEHRERLTALGRSAATVNHHVRACKSFARRMLIWRRISSDPLLGVEMLNVDADRRPHTPITEST